MNAHEWHGSRPATVSQVARTTLSVIIDSWGLEWSRVLLDFLKTFSAKRFWKPRGEDRKLNVEITEKLD